MQEAQLIVEASALLLPPRRQPATVPSICHLLSRAASFPGAQVQRCRFQVAGCFPGSSRGAMKRDPLPLHPQHPPPPPSGGERPLGRPQQEEDLAAAEGGPPKSPLWVFGYGSLVWRPDFEFTSRKVGFIRGYTRRFWQGDTFHRGSEKMPGRVVTLQEDYEGCTWGVAYELRGDQIAASLKYLNMREAVLGGYDTKLVKFHPQDKETEPILALVYIATPQNPSYLGPASEEDIAAQIIVSSGRSGHNIEYLLRLADFMRYFCPQVEDEHLFSIEEALISILPYIYQPEESSVEE
ncbi:glutathione-specific gamma-glutamylcyclotransferase 1 [Podarcis muralis]